jgi:hypothetical protein
MEMLKMLTELLEERDEELDDPLLLRLDPLELDEELLLDDERRRRFGEGPDLSTILLKIRAV